MSALAPHIRPLATRVCFARRYFRNNSWAFANGSASIHSLTRRLRARGGRPAGELRTLEQWHDFAMLQIFEPGEEFVERQHKPPGISVET